MLYLLCSLGGVIIGSIVTQIVIRWKAGYGYFKVERMPDEEENDLYKVNIALTRDQQLLRKKTIILKRDPSQK